MATQIGSVTVRLLAQVASNEPIEIGTLDIPLSATRPAADGLTVVINTTDTDPATLAVRIAHELGRVSLD